MNERAERINGWAAMIGVIAAMGSYAVSGQIIPGIWQNLQLTIIIGEQKMLLLATCMMGAFILHAALSDKDVDDDDDQDGGMMIPAYNPI